VTFLLASLSGCALFVGQATQELAGDLTTAILNQDDPETVRDGAPAYLLMTDALIEGDPENAGLLLSGAQLYGAYASAFVKDEARRKRLALRALDYGQRALCLRRADLCAAAGEPFDAFVSALGDTGHSDLATLYGFGSAWAGWVQANSDDWRAVAEIPKITSLMERIVSLDDAYERGGPHLYLGVLATQRPATLGGQPERGRAHFERAIELSEGRDLMAKVLFADQYGRLVFDREIHDRLLGEVVEADPIAPGLTLTNTLAQARALELLAEADDYF